MSAEGCGRHARLLLPVLGAVLRLETHEERRVLLSAAGAVGPLLAELAWGGLVAWAALVVAIADFVDRTGLTLLLADLFPLPLARSILTSCKNMQVTVRLGMR